jgi:hypothetical protein
MTALIKLIVHKNRIRQIFRKNSSNEIRSNEIRIRQELPVLLETRAEICFFKELKTRKISSEIF